MKTVKQVVRPEVAAQPARAAVAGSPAIVASTYTVTHKELVRAFKAWNGAWNGALSGDAKVDAKTLVQYLNDTAK